MPLLDQLLAAVATMRYREAWSLPPRLSWSMSRFLRAARPVRSPVGIVVHPYAPPIGGEPFRRYLRGMRRMANGEHVPLVAHISVTDECGYACRGCSNLPTGEPARSARDLVDLIGALRDAGTVCVAFTGGEPLLRADLEDLVAACGDGISPTLFTSGQGCSAARAMQLRAAGLQRVFVSLDHYRAAVHDEGRQCAGAFDRALGAVASFVNAGVHTAVQAVIGEDLSQPGELDKFLGFCGGLGVHEVMLLEPVPVRGGRVPASAAARTLMAAAQVRSARDMRLPKVSAMSFLESPDCLGCQAGFSFLYVRANGDVFPCDFLPESVGNMYRDGPQEVLRRLAERHPRPVRQCLALDPSHECGVNPAHPGRLPGALSWLPPRAR
jgi:MoaA/NifB/PqqE/SkfB family radical SAM enzyme